MESASNYQRDIHINMVTAMTELRTFILLNLQKDVVKRTESRSVLRDVHTVTSFTVSQYCNLLYCVTVLINLRKDQLGAALVNSYSLLGRGPC